ncbi:MAG TPA: NAD-dependent epimerase/dehydratase family protein [Verrucomicrobiae bacterium]|nr:NAD-dependent epimerase/dehydratase family protein [Verrucomicrobiae bacterium]
MNTEAELDELLTRPRQVLVDFIRTIRSPLVILGAGGKMGPTLAALARRAAEAAKHPLRVIAVSRFSDKHAKTALEKSGVETCEADLLQRESYNRLPDAENIIYLVGLKFGTAQNPSLTWAVNTLVPAYAVERYGNARMIALSTGNVYPLVPVKSGGATEEHPLTPIGEYANAAVARERVFEYCADKHRTSLALLRLNYAVELRYGVLVDIARRVWAGETIDLANGYFNCIWQGDANECILRSLGIEPGAWNLTGPDILRVRSVAEQFGKLFSREVRFINNEADTALLNNPAKICKRLGPPPTSLQTMIEWIAHWVTSGGRNLGKPTHYEVRDGTY